MPRKPIDYTNAVIYKLTCKNPEITDIYVGSTTQFTKRKNQHKSACNNKNNKRHHLNVYQFIRGNGSWINWQMVEIEKYRATDKLDLERRERYWLEQLHATLNSYVPTRTQKQYYEDNRERFIKYRKEYNEKHKDKISKQTKEYREKHKDKISKQTKEYREKHKDQLAKQKKQYYEDNREQIKNHHAEYYEANRERILNRIKEKVVCECSSVIRRGDKARHERTNKHKQYIASL